MYSAGPVVEAATALFHVASLVLLVSVAYVSKAFAEKGKLLT
jgi:hypothetical protein